MNNKKSNDKEKNNFLIIIILSSIIISIITLILFLCNRIYCIKCPAATDVFGHYGDFIGGTVGTILSVTLLYFTFKSQIEEFQENTSVFKKQQLNENFFHLLQQYNSIIGTLKVKSAFDENEVYLCGKEALHQYWIQIQNDYDVGDFNKGRKVAVEFYMQLYSSLKDVIPIYFRTIYRILDLIENSPVDDSEKVGYAKILRCQLTDTEIALMRYNAMTVLGKNLREYIVKYNLLKHLSPMSLLEYNRWSRLFNESDKNKVNVILFIIRKEIHTLLFDGEINTRAYTSSKAKYNLNFSKFTNGSRVKVDFNRRLNILIRSHDNFSSLDHIPVKTLIELLEEWLKEIFIFSSFGMVNGKIEIERNLSNISDDKVEHFSIVVSSKNNKQLSA